MGYIRQLTDMWSKATSCFLFGVLLLPALRAGEDIPVLIERLKTDDYAVYRATLARLAQAGEAAVPDLIRALDEPSIRYDAMEALRRIGRPAVPELVRSVQAGNGMAIETLGRIGPAAAEAVPVLNTLVTNRHLAGPTAMALSRIGTAGVPGLNVSTMRISWAWSGRRRGKLRCRCFLSCWPTPRCRTDQRFRWAELLPDRRH